MKAQAVTRILTIFSLIAILVLAFQSVPTISAAAKIFEDGFETGDFSKWSYVNGNLTVISGEAHFGTYNAVLDDAGEYAQVRFEATPVDHVFMRAYVMFKSFPAIGEQTTVLGVYNFSSSQYMAEARVINVAGTLKWALRYYDNGVYYIVASDLEKPVLDIWYSVEVEGKSNTTTDAESKIFINGNELTDISQTGKNNNLPINCGYIWANTADVRWYDDVVIDTTYIGPILPATTTTGAASGVTTIDATLNGIINPNGNDTTVTFDYGMTPEYGSTIIATPSLITGTSSTAVSAVIPDLTTNTTYHFRVVGLNAGGTSEGEDATFTTAITLTITGPSSVTYGSPETITTSGGSGTGALSYSAGESTGCTVDGTSGEIMVTDTFGTCAVTAMKAADDTYSAQISAAYPITLNKRAVTLSGSRTYDGSNTANYHILTISNKVGIDDLVVDSGSAMLENADVGLRPIVSIGTLALGGADVDNYTLTGATGAVTITRADQVPLIITGPASVTVGSVGTITTSGGSGTGALSYSAGESTGCTVDAITGIITVTDISGTCTVIATKEADMNYNTATSPEYTVILNPLLIFLPFIVQGK
jgi:hypothetical protein